MRDDEVVWSAVIELRSLNGLRIVERYGPFRKEVGAVQAINSRREAHTTKCVDRPVRERFVRGWIETGRYVWDAVPE